MNLCFVEESRLESHHFLYTICTIHAENILWTDSYLSYLESILKFDKIHREGAVIYHAAVKRFTRPRSQTMSNHCSVNNNMPMIQRAVASKPQQPQGHHLMHLWLALWPSSSFSWLPWGWLIWKGWPSSPRSQQRALIGSGRPRTVSP